MDKITLGNIEGLNSKIKLSHKSKTGVLLSLCFAVGIGSFVGIIAHDHEEEFKSVIPTIILEEPGELSINKDYLLEKDAIVIPTEDSIKVSIDDINSLNIIINDDNCMGDFINSVCQELDIDGIKFTFTAESKDVDVDDAVVITLDQQYMAGPGMLVFAPYENGGNNNSDALALAAQTAFYDKGFLMDNIACGQLGFRENKDGSISERVPTNTEDAIGKDKSTSFVTISFGTNNTSASLVAEAIEDTLIRYCSYISNEYNDGDLIYCVEAGESYDDISSKLGISSDVLDDYNNTIDEAMLLTGETIINPVVEERVEFDRKTATDFKSNEDVFTR